MPDYFRHVNDAAFGLDKSHMEAALDNLRKRIGPNRLDSVSAEIVLRTAYEQSFGIFDHDNTPSKDRPLALVACHPKEDYLPYSGMYRAMCDFAELKIYQETGVSWHQYMRQPRFENVLLQEMVKSKRMAEETKENSKLHQAEREFGKYTKKQ